MTEQTVPVGCMIVVAGVARRWSGTWLSPAATFSLVWAVQGVLSLIVADYEVWPGTLWWILLTTVVFCLGTLIAPVFVAGDGSAVRSIVFARPEAVIVLCFAAALGYLVATDLAQLDPSIDRPGAAFQLLLAFNYTGPLLSGMICASRTMPRRRQWLTGLSLLPPAAFAILFTGRTAIVAPVVFWIAGYLVVEVATAGRVVRLFTPVRILAGATVVAAFLVLGSGLYVLRLVREPYMTFTEKLVIYQETANLDDFISSWTSGGVHAAVFGSIAAFSYYFEAAWRDGISPRWGDITFAAPLEFFGLGGDRYPWESFEIAKDVSTNVYSMFRAPLDDFSFVGSLLWWLVVGVAQGWAYTKARHGAVIALPVLAWFYVDIVVTFSFRYNVIMLAYGLGCAYILLFTRVEETAALTSRLNSPSVPRPTRRFRAVPTRS